MIVLVIQASFRRMVGMHSFSQMYPKIDKKVRNKSPFTPLQHFVNTFGGGKSAFIVAANYACAIGGIASCLLNFVRKYSKELRITTTPETAKT